MELVDVVFSAQAEKLVEQYEGIANFVVPQGGFAVGDKVVLRFVPGSVVLEFVCTARCFDYAQADKPLLRLTLDLH